MLASLADLGYEVEWRVVNAADYGFPQKRRRVFIIGRLGRHDDSPKEQLLSIGRPCPCAPGSGARAVRLGADRARPRHQEGERRVRPRRAEDAVRQCRRHADPAGRSGRGRLDDRRRAGLRRRPRRSSPTSSKPTADVPEQFFVDDEDLAKWQFLKGAKSLTRISRATGLEYTYDEGPIPFPDPIDRPSRTILTGEGGATPSRFKHLIQTEDGRYRRLTPRELERLNGFPGDWTAGMSDGKRAFMMGNALVVGARRTGRRRARSTTSPPRSRRRRPERVAVLASRRGRAPAPEPAAEQSGRPQRHARQPSARHRTRTTPPAGAARGAPRRLSTQLAQGARSTGHRLPRPQGRDLRPRLLLAPLPALLPEPPEVEPGVLGAQVRAQPRARCPQAARPRGGGWVVDRGLGVRRPRSVDRMSGRVARCSRMIARRSPGSARSLPDDVESTWREVAIAGVARLRTNMDVLGL